MRYLEKTGRNIDNAVTEALIELGATRDQVTIEIIEKGSKGFLGIGVKAARVRVTIKVEEDDLGFLQEPTEVKQECSPTQTEVINVQKQPKSQPSVEVKVQHQPKKQQSQVEAIPSNKEALHEPKSEQIQPVREKSVVNTNEAVECAKNFLLKVLKEMDIEPSFQIEVVDKRINIDISGNKMGLVIGKRGETLDSLQYLVNIVVNKGQEGYIKVMLDTENYRARREETLRKVALKFAKKASELKKPVALEPMNPYDRRIIHAVLQNSKIVKTHSEGREPFRKVIISPIGYTKKKKQ